MAIAMMRPTATFSSASLSPSFFFLPCPPSFFFHSQRGTLHFLRQSSSYSPQSLSSSASSSTSSKPSLVSTAPVKQAPAPGFHFQKEIARLQTLRMRLSNADTLREKLLILDVDDRVRDFFRSGWSLPSLNLKEEYLIKCLIATGQGHTLGWGAHHGDGMGGHHVAGNNLKEAFYKLADMIERWTIDGAGVKVKQEDVRKDAVSDPLKKLMKILDDVEDFYDCFGGIIGNHGKQNY